MQALGQFSQSWIALAGEGRACDAVDVGAFDAEVPEFPVGHAAQLGDRLTILAPVVKRACDIHLDPPFNGLSKPGSQSVAPRFASMNTL